MALRRKPRSEPHKSSSVDERRIESLINKGGSVAPDHEEGKEIRPQLVQLRLSRSLVQRIDKVRQQRLVAPSRHTWLLEALLEKLETEEHQRGAQRDQTAARSTGERVDDGS